MNDERKVIPFGKAFKKNLVSTTPNDLRAAATGTMAFILLLMVGFNFHVFESPSLQVQQQTQKAQRGLASVPQVLAPQWKKSLKDLHQSEIKVQAQRPSAVDGLTYGYLKGQYILTMENGLVKAIQLSSTSQMQPTAINDSQKFMNEYGQTLVPEMKSILSSKRESTSAGFKEVFRIETEKVQKNIVLSLDHNNGLLGITVE